MENNSPEDLKEKWRGISIGLVNDAANTLSETVAFLERSKGIIRPYNSQTVKRLKRRIKRRSKLPERNIFMIVSSIIYAQYFICPPPFIQVENPFRHHIYYVSTVDAARTRALQLIENRTHLLYYENAINLSMLLNSSLPTSINAVGFEEPKRKPIKGNICQTYANSYHIVFPYQFLQPEVFNIVDIPALNVPITFEDLRTMNEFDFKLPMGVPILKEVGLRFVVLTILLPVQYLLDMVFSREAVGKVSLHQEESINCGVLPDLLFTLKTKTLFYFVPIELKSGSFNNIIEAAKIGDLENMAALAAQCCSQAFTTYSPISILMNESYIMVFEILFEGEQGQNEFEYYNQYINDLPPQQPDLLNYRYGNFQVTLYDHTNGTNSLASIILKLVYVRFRNANISITRAINRIWSSYAKSEDIRQYRQETSIFGTNKIFQPDQDMIRNINID
ncbi:uncharacterized protein RJT21DRAFT_120632 [Scheffersomyces amazonensis]|uniref:uncharacterized protein n=1 Tax=Scheffersomyces amazonensis TaxID=1078765 RepID=UPI00315D5821